MTHSPFEGWDKMMRKLAVAQVARDWANEREPTTTDEAHLLAAVFRAYPEDVHTKETCNCGEPETCEECPTAAQAEAIITRWEQEGRPPA